ncbi:hypothetical protein D3C72_2508550 [compost metagenome]
MQFGQCLQQVPELFVKVSAIDLGQTEEVLPLPYPNDHPNPRSEADDHWVRNELDDGAQASDAK